MRRRNVVTAAAANSETSTAKFIGGLPHEEPLRKNRTHRFPAHLGNVGAKRGKTLSSSQAVLELWNDIGRKLIAMAEDFPEDRYDFKPIPAQRSFAEQMLHAVGSNDLFTSVAKGEKPVDDESRATTRQKPP